MAITNPANGAVFTAPASFTLAASASDSDGSVTQVQFFQATTSLGVDTTSPYSVSVSGLVAGSYTFSAVATDNAGAKSTNSISLTVNALPTASITSPTNNASFFGPTNITIDATANDTDGTISKVEFFNGATKIGEDSTNPYSLTWSNVPVGSYTLTVRAIDNLGGSNTSAAVIINVVSNAAPTVSITGPTNNATFVATTNITITANANDSDGTIAKVEFFQGTNKLGEDFTSPYSLTWSNVAAGTYTLTAKATDNLGAVTISAAVSFSVSSRPANPVAMLSPAWVGTDFLFSFASETGRTYGVAYKNALDGSDWQSLTNLTGDGAILKITNRNPSSATRFYRVGAQ